MTFSFHVDREDAIVETTCDVGEVDSFLLLLLQLVRNAEKTLSLVRLLLLHLRIEGVVIDSRRVTILVLDGRLLIVVFVLREPS